jgi:NADPH-dependent 2,4-dienoyl-CoA reductase/sulfur reductase-like enzyme
MTARHVVVVGAGPAGIAAATSAAEAGRSVLLVDEGARAGGQIWRHRERSMLPEPARERLARLDASGARTLFSATVLDLTTDRRLSLEVDGTPLVVAASQAVILCTGARERFVPFPGWTLPGVIGVGGAQALLKSGMQVKGRRVVIAGTGPLLLPVAAALAHAGALVQVVVEQASFIRVAGFAARLFRTPARLVDAARYRAAFGTAPYHTGTWVTTAIGRERVDAARIVGAAGVRTIACDLLCVGYGLIPATELARLVGCALQHGAVEVDGRQETSIPGIFCAGEPTGIAGVDAAVTQGEIAGLAAVGAHLPARLLRQRAADAQFARHLERAFALRDELRTLATKSTIVCRCEDVKRESLEQCSSFREARLHTRVAMGPCQGRVCAPALEVLFGWTGDSVRPPVAPALVGTLAGATTPSRAAGVLDNAGAAASPPAGE